MNAKIENITFKGAEALRLTTHQGASAVVSLLGGQVLSWVPPRGKEWLYLSEQADFSGTKPIRGGVPVCFPQFAEHGSLPKHGFLRTKGWEVLNQRTAKEYALVVLGLEDDADTREIWPYGFTAELAIGLEGGRLDMELEITNRGDEPFSFTTALHTYLRVAEVEQAALQGLHGLNYLDATLGGEMHTETAPELMVESEVDRIYFKAPQTLMLQDGQRALGIRSENFPDVVVWNPWEHKTATLPDMAPLDFRRMLCVEAAQIGQAITLGPGESWWGRQTLADLAVSELLD